MLSHSMPATTIAPPRSALALRRWALRRMLAGPVAGLLSASLAAQTPASSPADTQAHTVRGQVVNALDGSPLPRALVTVNARSALTDYQGRFAFANFADANAYLSVRKPGFSADANTSGGNATQRLTNLDAPVVIPVFPDALVVGTLTGQDGAPLSHVPVRLLHALYDGAVLRWVPAGFAATNARGEYRISTPAGRFRLVSSFVAHSFETGESVLPGSFPEPSQTSPSTLVEVHSGEERRIDLRVRTGPLYPVTLHVDFGDAQRRNLRVLVSTSAGDEFFTGLSADQRVELPLGSYALKLQMYSREESMSGSSRITVTSRDSSGAAVHLAPDAEFTVELLAGSLVSSASNTSISNGLTQLPNVQQLNLLLHNELANGSLETPDISLSQAAGKTSAFRVSPGRYRLVASGGGSWHIQSATLGATDLLQDDLVVGPGSAGGTMRLLVSNLTGTVHARTPLPAGSPPLLYLIPRGPSLTSIHPLFLSADGTGAASVSAVVPAGNYTALLVQKRLEEDPRDPAFLASFASGPVDVDVQPGADASFTLDLAKRKEAER